VSLADVTATLSLATDVAMGMPLESGLAICLRAVALAEAAGLDSAARNRVHHLALLRHIGCTAENPQFVAIVGDELAFREAVGSADLTSPRAFMPQVLRHLVRTNGLMGTAAKLAQMAASSDRMQESALAVCEVAEQLADQLGLPEMRQDLLLSIERWDGKSFLKRARGDGVPIAVRVVQIAECATVYDALGGPEAAAAKVRERAGRAFDPQLAETFAQAAVELLGAADCASRWDAVVSHAPTGSSRLEAEQLDAALAAIGEFSDLKSPYTVGHSAGVARLAEEAARQAGLPEYDALFLRRCGLVHDLGRVCVSSTIWEKDGELSPDEWEQVRLHPYHGERLLGRSAGLATLAATAALHHERCDGSGYHRGADGRSLPFPARLLAAADAFHAMTEPRPHRPARSPEEAAE
jgi:HD-GYP domain-containing protein (c-di-GMP phosphodiesterase class II)